GSDATRISSGQFDFETVVIHELGHALGLGHSTDSTSVMFATLNPGSVNRNLTRADLNVADSDTTGASGLPAAIPSNPASTSETGFVAGDDKPSFQGRNQVDGDTVFALLGAEQLPIGSHQLQSLSDEPRRTVSAGPVDAVFARVSGQPIFAA